MGTWSSCPKPSVTKKIGFRIIQNLKSKMQNDFQTILYEPTNSLESNLEERKEAKPLEMEDLSCGFNACADSDRVTNIGEGVLQSIYRDQDLSF